jgi:alcohol dehydrogenase class IV
MPPEVTAASGLDVLCHALESFTAKPFDAFEAKTADQRVAYCGANPVSDTWVERTLPLVARSLRAAVRDGSDLAARRDMALAAMFAGMGFGNAGVHIPHACAYPIAGRVRDYHPAGYPGDEPMVPHGQAVALTAPAAFRFTYSADPDRHLLAAELLEPDGAAAGEPKEERLAGAVTRLMRDVGMPNGLGAVQFSPSDVPDLVEGALQQQRLLSIAPKDPGPALEGIFRDSFEIW